jgi:hypothetical protein
MGMALGTCREVRATTYLLSISSCDQYLSEREASLSLSWPYHEAVHRLSGMIRKLCRKQHRVALFAVVAYGTKSVA